MPLGETIVALASPPGRSPRALIRISGPGTRALLASVLFETPARPISAARLRLTPTLSLPMLLVTARAPRSYTGEDAAELLIPGNPALIDRVLALLTSHAGVRPASPGEFTARAYLNGKLTLDQAEGVAATVAAQSDEQLSTARNLLSGSTGKRYRAWAEELATLLALVEAGIDFSDQEDVVAITPADLAMRLQALLDSIDSLAGESAAASPTLPRVVLVGAPNAGKSTLFNALLGRRRAVVSPIPGTTRDIIEEPLDLSSDAPGAGPILLVDIAGLDDAEGGSIHIQAQAAAVGAIRSADTVLHCDPAAGFPALATDAPVIRVRTKADLPGAARSEAVAVCALDGWNLGVLRRAIADSACARGVGALAAVLPRHRRALDQTRLHIRGALGTTTAGAEVTAGNLRLALDSLGELTGRISPDEVIGRIFSTFCIGK